MSKKAKLNEIRNSLVVKNENGIDYYFCTFCDIKTVKVGLTSVTAKKRRHYGNCKLNPNIEDDSHLAIEEGTINGFVIPSLSEDKKKLAESLLVKVFYSSDISFNFANNPYFIQYSQLLRPTFKQPDRKKVGDSFLSEEVRRMNTIKEERVKTSKYISLSADGLSNLQKRSIWVFCVGTPEPLIYDFEDGGASSYNGTYICDKVSKRIEEIDPEKKNP